MKVSKAIVNDRRIKIMRLIEEKRSVSVDELVEKYHVSPITIRRDLQYWEDKGAIIRNYGGASLIRNLLKMKNMKERPFKKQSPRGQLYILRKTTSSLLIPAQQL